MLQQSRLDSFRHFERTATVHEQRFGRVFPTHRERIDAFVNSIDPHGLILDAACGIGNYFGQLTSRGHTVLGIDQSPAMLAVAKAQWPKIGTRCLKLQDLAAASDLNDRFSGVVCVDALEWIMEEDWPIVAAGLRSTMRSDGTAYVNIEIPSEIESYALSQNVIQGNNVGEILVNGHLNHFPSQEKVIEWCANGGLRVADQRTGDGYWHLFLVCT